MAEKLYLVKETQFGFTVEGPNNHKWQATTEDGWTRAVAFAKALERAYLEGQKSVTSDMDLMVTFELIKSLGEDAETVSIDDLKARVRMILAKATKVSQRLEEARADNISDRVAKDKRKKG